MVLIKILKEPIKKENPTRNLNDDLTEHPRWNTQTYILNRVNDFLYQKVIDRKSEPTFFSFPIRPNFSH